MYKIPFINLPGFRKFDNEGFEHLFPVNKSALEQYDYFKETIISGMDVHKYVPVMRMCDGEYIYSVGEKKGYHQGLIGVFKNLMYRLFRNQTTSWGENYSRTQNRQLKKRFPELLRFISEHGFIANHFVYSRHHFCEEYIDPVCKWYKKHGITINNRNFTSFYFVYVLLNGPDSLALFNNRSVLIISSFNEAKRVNVEKELKRRGAVNIYFQQISATSSMLDVLDLSSFKDKTDLVLIAAGIGSANILYQCQTLEVPCIDSGFCMECMADVAKRSERIFCLPDQDF